MTTDIRALIADDGYAASFQSMGQYRTALLAALRAQADAEAVAIVGSDFQLGWIGSGPIAPIVAAHNIKVGDKLYTNHSLPAAQGLSDDEIESEWRMSTGHMWPRFTAVSVVTAEDLLKFAKGIRFRNAATVAEPSEVDASVVRAALIGLANHVRAVPAYSKLLGDMESVDKAIALLAAQQQAEPVGGERAKRVLKSIAARRATLADLSERGIQTQAITATLDDCADLLRDLAAQSGQRAGVAEGWKMVPMTPTVEMLVAAGEAFFDVARNWKQGSTRRDQDAAESVYRSFLAAAPTQQQERSE